MTDNEAMIQYLAYKAYMSEFVVIDGLRQHREGLNYVQWWNETIKYFKDSISKEIEK